MAKKQRSRDFHEPWSLERSTLWKLGYKTPPKTADSPEELRVAVADWEAARSKAEKNADVLITGSRMTEAAVAPTLLGDRVYYDDRRIITGFRRILGLPDGSPTHEELAQRAAECVNAMAGIGEPAVFMGELVAFLTDMSRSPIDEYFDGRATRLLFKVAQHHELIAAHAEDTNDPE